ncbi:glycosyltransferase [Seonamhaeicola maritimus]|uniref:Glycosyltransferase family 4 protein n=1 Tax=Seonamhaeicola maritimus TaxID=2591822 RepID=A0A5C7GI85_9FLAO|nr:glycosyltransferase [Seonamhaeicola maritimus]TXG37149.1 glycosyltransferase family 4 protein [Seonamhaeicola maritimus]
MKVAIIHYWFITRRGGEKVVESILKLFPDADIYTLFYDKNTYGNHLGNHKIYTSSLDKWGFLRKNYQKFFPLYPYGIKSLKLLDDYDLIISSESGPAKGIEIPNGTPHVCYIHSPMRYCWGFTQEYLVSVNRFLRPILSYFFKRLKNWDKNTINNVDLYIANSMNVAKRVKKFYNRESSIVYPPISNDLFEKKLEIDSNRDIFLSFGAITPYKRVDLLIDTFNKNGEKLIVIGDGSELAKLRKKANKNIEFKGSLRWLDIEEVLSRTRALLFPGEEDFGMIPLEVMAYGIPVIAYKKGGALETVIENDNFIQKSSGLFFEHQSVDSLQSSINQFKKLERSFDPSWIRDHAKKFREQIFLKKISSEINNFLDAK